MSISYKALNHFSINLSRQNREDAVFHLSLAMASEIAIQLAHAIFFPPRKLHLNIAPVDHVECPDTTNNVRRSQSSH